MKRGGERKLKETLSLLVSSVYSKINRKRGCEDTYVCCHSYLRNKLLKKLHFFICIFSQIYFQEQMIQKMRKCIFYSSLALSIGFFFCSIFLLITHYLSSFSPLVLFLFRDFFPQKRATASKKNLRKEKKGRRRKKLGKSPNQRKIDTE